MADCHRRVFRRQLVKAASGPTTRDGATVQPPPTSEDAKEVYGGLSCEIVSDLCPNPFSHDWHVQPSCQRPNRLPPERRAFRSRRTHYESESGCPRNLLTISSARDPVDLHIPQHLHMFSTCGACLDLGNWGALGPPKALSFRVGLEARRGTCFSWRLITARNGMVFRLGETKHRIIGAGRSGRQKIEKRSYWRSLL